MTMFDDAPRSVISAQLDEALKRELGQLRPGEANEAAALEVLARVLPYVRDTSDVVGNAWPYDGPHSAESVKTAASAMRELGRYLNNATQNAKKTLYWGVTIGSVIGNVKDTLYQLEQLLEQLGTAAMAIAEDPTVYSDQTPYDPDKGREQYYIDRHQEGVRTAMTLADQLNQLRHTIVEYDSTGMRVIGGLAKELEKPHTLANRLGHEIPEDD